MSYNIDTSHNSPNYTPEAQSAAVFGRARTIEGITIHWWGDPNQNPSFAGVRDYLCRANGNTSAHFVASGTGRQVAWIVGANDVAWHSGNAVGNAITIGIECDPRCRDEDYDVVAELVADIRSAYGDIPIYSHNMWSSTSCPGNYDIDRIDRLSYTKQSNANWGEVTNKVVTPPVVVPPVETPKPLYRLFVNNNQVAAYSVESNAYAGYIAYGKTGALIYEGKDVTNELIAKYTVPSPTTQDPTTGEPVPGSGAPVTEKPDYSEENNTLLKYIKSVVDSIAAFLARIFK